MFGFQQERNHGDGGYLQTSYNLNTDAYIYSEQEPLRDDVFKCLGDRPSVLQAREIGERIIRKMKEFVEVFEQGVAA